MFTVCQGWVQVQVLLASTSICGTCTWIVLEKISADVLVLVLEKIFAGVLVLVLEKNNCSTCIVLDKIL